MPTIGMRTNASRIGTTEVNIGRPLIRSHGPGIDVGTPCQWIGDPTDNTAKTAAVTAIARTVRSRHSHTITTASRTTSGQPKNDVSSAKWTDVVGATPRPARVAWA